MEQGYIPSFCTACYRAGRQGDRFMELCKNEQIAGFCHPNALMTLEEYLLDYASDKTRALGENLINQEMDDEAFKQSKVYDTLQKNLDAIKQGTRDLRF